MASSNDLFLHENALVVFNNLVCDLNSGNIAICNQHFNVKSEKAFLAIVNNIHKFAEQLKKISIVEKQSEKQKSFLKKRYNITLNVVRQKLAAESCLLNILFIDNNLKFVSHKEAHVPRRVNLVGIADVDFIVGSESNENTKLQILKLSVGRCGFETPEEMLQFLLTLVERSGIDDLVMKQHYYKSLKTRENKVLTRNSKKSNTTTNEMRVDLDGGVNDGGGKFEVEKHNLTFMLNLKFEDRTILSSSPKIKHFLFGSNWKVEKTNFDVNNCSQFVKTTLYHQYNVAVRKKIMQLIEMKTLDPNFKYMTLKCCRISPPCDLIHIESRSYTSQQAYTCLCGMQLCGLGCGKEYHGNFPCNISSDEATELFVQSHKKCPKCNYRVHKESGCNHITCICQAEFCYVCVEEYEKDSYGHYMIDEHHQSRCPQFDSNVLREVW